MTTSIRSFRLALGVLFITFSGKLIGQDQRLGVPEILNFSKSAYHAGTQNWCAVQDVNDILVVGNNKGVLSFDGSNWELTPLPNRTIVRSLASSPDGRIYVGAQDEMGYLTQDNSGQLSYQSLVDQLSAEDRSFEDVWKIFPTETATYFGSRKAFFIFQNGTVTSLKPRGRFETFFKVGNVLYAQDTGVGLMKWEGQQFVKAPQGELFLDSRVAAILPYGKRHLIISDFKGLFFLSANGIEPWEAPVSDFLKANQAYCGIRLTDGNFAIGTAQNGLILIDSLGQPINHFNKQSGLQNNTILHILQDRQHNFWLMLDNGIDYVKFNAPFSLIHSESGLEGTGYSSIVHQDKLFVGTNQGLSYIDWPPARNIIPAQSFKKVDELRGQIWSLQVIDDQLIANTHESAYSIERGQVKRISPIPGSWKFLALEKHPGFALQGTYTGLFLYERTTNGVSREWVLRKKIEGLEESARVIEEDSDGNIWVSHAYKGLYKISLSEDLTATIDFYDKSKGLPSTISLNVVKIKGETVFTTPAGVYRYESASDRFVPYANFNQIFDAEPKIQRLIEDEEGRIWFSLDEQFGYLAIKDQGFLRETEIERQLFNHIQDDLVDGFEHIHAIDDQHVIIAAEQGFINYSPSRGKDRQLSFHCLIREVKSLSVPDSTLYGQGLGTLPDNDIKLELNSQLNSLRFHYASPFFEHIGQIQYRHQLKGFSDNWSTWSDRSEKEFTNLPHGSYEFQVQAKNAYGQISQPAVCSLVIAPPWYTTFFAKGIYLLLISLGIFMLFRYNSHKLEREKNSLLVKQEKKLAEKEASFRKKQEQSEAEIIRLRNENLQTDVDNKTARLASATMHLVQKGEAMLRIKKDLNKLLKTELPSDSKRKVEQLIRSIDKDIQLEQSWGQFEAYFDQVHENFLQNLRAAYPKLTPKDQKLCAYLRMNLSTKEIAPLMNISVRGVEISRYRLRKKLELDTDTNLTDFIMRF